MKERPILFSGEMVKAILNGRKTQTRRVISPQPPEGYKWTGWILSTTGSNSDVGKAQWNFGDTTMINLIRRPSHKVRCLFGAIGDRLWVRETWYQITNKDFSKGQIIYRTDGWEREDKGFMGWKPSIHMPRWASRITLEITGIRAERVQNISEDDCWHEGISLARVPTNTVGYRDIYQELWDSLNAKRGYSWESNPWVWVIEFKRID